MATLFTSWTLATRAGTGDPGFSGDGRPASQASLNEPKGLAIDGEGHLFVADSENHVVRRVDRVTGLISTVVGCASEEVAQAPQSGGSDSVYEEEVDPLAETSHKTTEQFTQQTDLSGTVRYLVGAAAPKRYGGDGGPATEALLNFPTAVAVDARGHLYIADTMNHRIRRVDAQTGIITTIAGTGQARFSGDGGPADRAALNEPAALAIDAQGQLYIADQSNNRVRAVDLKTGIIRTVAGTGSAVYDGDGKPATESSLAGPSGLAVAAGTLYIADTFNGRIRSVDLATGMITTVAGDGGSYRYQSPDDPPSFSVSRPSGITLDREGNLFLTDSDSHLIRRWERATGLLTRIAGTGSASSAGDGGAALEAGLCYPFGIVADGERTLLIADTFNHRIRALSLE
jgi:sugar lactone lactonase YvrE